MATWVQGSNTIRLPFRPPVGNLTGSHVAGCRIVLLFQSGSRIFRVHPQRLRFAALPNLSAEMSGDFMPSKVPLRRKVQGRQKNHRARPHQTKIRKNRNIPKHSAQDRVGRNDGPTNCGPRVSCETVSKRLFIWG